MERSQTTARFSTATLKAKSGSLCEIPDVSFSPHIIFLFLFQQWASRTMRSVCRRRFRHTGIESRTYACDELASGEEFDPVLNYLLDWFSSSRNGTGGFPTSSFGS